MLTSVGLQKLQKAVVTAFLFEREKGFEPSTLSLGS